jgi:protease IV
MGGTMFKKILIGTGILMVALFLVIVVMGVLALRGLADNRVTVEPQTVLEIDIASLQSDYDTGSLRSVISGDALTVTNLLEGIAMAQADERIIAILLKSDLISSSWGNLREIRQALKQFRESGKPIYTHVAVTDDKGFYLASVASQIWLTGSASSGILLRGIGFERAYLKKLLAACGLEFEVVHAGRYKGAFENYSRDSMSAPVRENLTALMQDISSIYIGEIAESRGLEPRLIEELLQERESLFINGSEAVDLNLVDGVRSYVEMEAWLEDAFAGSPRLNVTDYIASSKSYYSHGDIAVIHFEGIISETTVLADPGQPLIDSETFLPILSQLRENEAVQAVVMRINSPGGSAAISEEIWQGARLLGAEKPLIVSMGGVAASGGYYIAAAGDYILAQPTTITGSIGVVGMIVDATQLLEWGRVNYEQVTTSPFHSFGHPAFRMSREQREMLQSTMGNVYDEFKQRVATGRSLTLEQVEEVAQGQVWTGRQALESGLVDELGSLDDAVVRAAESAGIDPATVRVTHYPRKKGLLQLFSEFDPGSILLPANATQLMEILEQVDDVDLLSELLQTRLVWELE